MSHRLVINHKGLHQILTDSQIKRLEKVCALMNELGEKYQVDVFVTRPATFSQEIVFKFSDEPTQEDIFALGILVGSIRHSH